MTTQPSHRFRPCLEILEPRWLPSGLDPTPVEQLFLEALNDARANPAVYGAAVGVDLSAVAPAPPLAFDSRLVQAARRHAQDMNVRAFFSHINPDGVDVPGRLTAAQYPWTSWGESIAGSPGWPQPADALRALVVDSGVADLGHRKQLLGMGSPYQGQTQVGIGVVQGGAGPLTNYHTVDTAASVDGRACLCGVVFEDVNANGRYDVGEGLGGVQVDVAGVGTVTTFASGGYTIPLGSGGYTVTAHGGGLRQPITRSVTIGAANVRLNFAEVPSNPVIYTVTADAGLYRHDDASGWTRIGATGTIRSISTATTSSGLVAFVITADQGLYRFDDRSGWARLGGTGTIAAASAGTDAAGRADVFVLTTAGALFCYGYASGWVSVGTPGPVQTFAAASNGRAFVTTPDQSVFSYAPSWGWSRLTAPGFAASMTVACEIGGSVRLFVVTTDGALDLHDDATGWTQLGAPGTIRSAVAGTDATGHANVFASTNGGALFKYSAVSGWQSLAPAGAYTATTPAAYDMVFAVAADGSLFEHSDQYGWFRLTGPSFARGD